MPETKTQEVLTPPPKNPVVATGFDDEIRDLGDRIAALKPAEADQLNLYLKPLVWSQFDEQALSRRLDGEPALGLLP